MPDGRIRLLVIQIFEFTTDRRMIFSLIETIGFIYNTSQSNLQRRRTIRNKRKYCGDRDSTIVLIAEIANLINDFVNVIS